MDELRIQTWQPTKAGSKNRNRPKQLSPLAKKSNDRQIGGTDLPQEDVMRWLDAVGPERDIAPVSADVATEPDEEGVASG